MRPVILLYAKAPLPGRVKTRLAASLGADRAAKLHEAFVRDVFDMLASHAGAADVELHTDIPTDAWAGLPVPMGLQSPGDLGQRMYSTLDTALCAGRPQAIIVGSDVPTLPAEHIRSLLGSAADVALGPCRDGGFYAIACRRVHPHMFREVHWSEREALEETLRACRACGLTVETSPEWYDVDTPEDLSKLLAGGPLPKHTRAWLAAEG
jgi:hypothetical protein